MTEFRSRVVNGETVIGTFVKSRCPSVVEALGHTPLDFVCLDVEHAPFDRRDIDLAVLAARATQTPLLVRLPDSAPVSTLNALDLGADGVVWPHVRSARDTEACVAAAAYGEGGRGYAGSTRSAQFNTRTMSDVIAAADRQALLVAQIEDAEAVERIDEIARCDGIDVFFIGPGDLAVSLGGASPADERIEKAIAHVCERLRCAGRHIGIFVASLADARKWKGHGVSVFIHGSDHAMMMSRSREIAAGIRP